MVFSPGAVVHSISTHGLKRREGEGERKKGGEREKKEEKEEEERSEEREEKKKKSSFFVHAHFPIFCPLSSIFLGFGEHLCWEILQLG